jgi:protocatechuate 3,4-dioxygenase beta subunit
MKRSPTAYSHHDSHASHRSTRCTPGLAEDLKVLTRRRLFGMVAKAAAGLSLAPVLVGCVTDNAAGDGVDAGTGGDSTTGTATCSTIPDETQGPYPGDGTNGANALTLSGIVRSDIRASVGGATGVAQGVVLNVTLTLLDSKTCSPLADRAIYIWHCDRDGNYSMYSAAVAAENYLRGVQVTDAAGQVTFTTIFPGCYSGRWPHIHFEIYPSLASATSGASKIATSQLALPKAICDTVYATSGYSASVTNLSRITLATDNVFSDGSTLQIPTITGSVADGIAAGLTVAINV